jgi:hypothetical protein
MPMRRRAVGWAGLGLLVGVLAAPPAHAQGQGGAPGRTGPVPGAVPVAPPADDPAVPFNVSTGAGSVLTKQLSPTRPTIFVFTKASSTLERQFLQQVCKDASRKAGVGLVSLRTGNESIAKRYEVTETPTAMVFDRRGRFVARSSDPEQIRGSLLKAVGVMRIDWPETTDPRYEQSTKLLGRPVTGGILRTMTFQPEWLAHINDLSRKSHFSPGYLDVRMKEMIASYVSALNHCKF